MRLVVLLAFAACAAITSSRAAPTSDEEFPELLSQWKLFEIRAQHLEPRDAMIYDLNTALFSDYALKLRTIRVPEASSIQTVNGELIFPVGTVISKTFYYPRAQAKPGTDRPAVEKTHDSHQGEALSLTEVRLLETRLLVHTESGWQGLPYVWNSQQTEATLALAGEMLPLTLADGRQQTDFDYIVPDANQCASCHAANGRTLLPIGLKIRHINKERSYGGRRKNQLHHWQDARLLTGTLPADLPTTARWDDTLQPLSARARAYLDVNCSHCHSESGAANNSGLLLDNGPQDPIHLGICKPPVAAGRGAGNDSFAIVPGSPRESIMVYRMQSTESDIAMPELGRSLVHEEGVELISAWIRGLDGECESRTP